MLTKLQIENLRGLDAATLDNLTTFNVLLGYNAVGKTTCLEAAALAANPHSVRAALVTAQWRDLPLPTSTLDENFRSLFPQRDPSKKPSILFVVDGVTQSLRIHPRAFHEQTADESAKAMNVQWDEEKVIGLVFEFERAGKRFLNAGQTPKDSRGRELGDLDFVSRQQVPDTLGCFTVPARSSISPGDTSSVLTDLIQRGQKSKLLDALNALHSQVKDGNVVTDVNTTSQNYFTVVWVTTGRGTLPLNVMGDGFCRLCLMSTGAFRAAGGLLLVDEIDSGLHRAAMPSVWKALRKLASPNAGNTPKFQMLCATHDEDMLLAAIEAFEEHPEMLAVYRLEPDEPGRPRVVRYGYEQLRYSFESGIDPRG